MKLLFLIAGISGTAAVAFTLITVCYFVFCVVFCCVAESSSGTGTMSARSVMTAKIIWSVLPILVIGCLVAWTPTWVTNGLVTSQQKYNTYLEEERKAEFSIGVRKEAVKILEAGSEKLIEKK